MDFQTAIPVTLIIAKVSHSSSTLRTVSSGTMQKHSNGNLEQVSSQTRRMTTIRLVGINIVIRVLPRTSKGITDLLLPQTSLR
jgi:hypothetical protein